MVLNFECVKDILHYLEKENEYKESPTSFEHKEILAEQIRSELGKYDENEFYYAIRHLVDGKLIDAKVIRDNTGNLFGNYCRIKDITTKGHMFLQGLL